MATMTEKELLDGLIKEARTNYEGCLKDWGRIDRQYWKGRLEGLEELKEGCRDLAELSQIEYEERYASFGCDMRGERE